MNGGWKVRQHQHGKVTKAISRFVTVVLTTAHQNAIQPGVAIGNWDAHYRPFDKALYRILHLDDQYKE